MWPCSCEPGATTMLSSVKSWGATCMQRTATRRSSRRRPSEVSPRARESRGLGRGGGRPDPRAGSPPLVQLGARDDPGQRGDRTASRGARCCRPAACLARCAQAGDRPSAAAEGRRGSCRARTVACLGRFLAIHGCGRPVRELRVALRRDGDGALDGRHLAGGARLRRAALAGRTSDASRLGRAHPVSSVRA